MSNRVFANMQYPPDYYAFQPGDLTFPGDGGFWLDFGDWDNMYLDTAMTVKVTAAGQKVAAVRDKGRNGMHHIQNDAGRRPTAVLQGGFKTLDFNPANFECLGSVNNGGMALAKCHGWIITETDAATNFQRFLSTSSDNTDTIGPSGLAINSGDASNLFDLRGLAVSGTPTLQVRAPGSGNTPFAVWEYDIDVLRSVKAFLWRDNVQVNTDSTITGTLQTFASGYSVVGVMSQNNALTTAGPLDGRIWQILHLGTIPSAFDEGRVEAWFNKWRY